MLSHSPTDTINFAGRQVFVKRDDKLHPNFSGNKARKFYHFLINDFPKVTRIVGSGSAQANSLYSLSVLAKMKGWQLDYYVSHISAYIQSQLQTYPVIVSNFTQAHHNGANIIQVDWGQAKLSGCKHLDDVINILKPEYLNRYSEQQILFIPEGGRCEYAKTGIYQLGCEIIDWAKGQNISALSVYLPSGTGTTAVFLQQYFIKKCQKEIIDIKVLTCSTVGGDTYLANQFCELNPDKTQHPTIINDGNKYHFGKLYLPLFELWNDVLETSGIEFDLLYDPIGLSVLKRYIEANQCPDRQVLYIHQGGLLGNATMLPRYKRKLANT
ncbi:1-aminocyclopropane-1-carboxylate deaminase/D-cysteine desulfhydrase [Shewanella glacialimarina]|jgi:1-aminocyclopropane-1-carboxylate deaminase|uniref:1-aminocyclopropane-1-carboxylate deaminase/D-cysteine desulfhydrase n=1 Tax=Shewanella glacialimarina TaxID=2590884 RepID=UPI001CF8BA5D|nr:1-aminocyclopropane-1-carboxylate deaminase/D-cysteine desulfhydrase [Shewanella glacialimarina]UCX04675.1 1-aminocyclopropane-1-carboxylate deaminase/D-cysteine desulfhydrase [Shewanella glacialimarina]